MRSAAAPASRRHEKRSPDAGRGSAARASRGAWTRPWSTAPSRPIRWRRRARRPNPGTCTRVGAPRSWWSSRGIRASRSRADDETHLLDQRILRLERRDGTILYALPAEAGVALRTLKTMKRVAVRVFILERSLFKLLAGDLDLTGDVALLGQ